MSIKKNSVFYGLISINKETTPLSLVLFADKSLLPLNSQSIAHLPRTGCTLNTLTDNRTHNSLILCYSALLVIELIFL